MTTKLIVGLGNKGDKYTLTRHNAGFLCVDDLAAKVASSEVTTSNLTTPPIFEVSNKCKSDIFASNNLILAKPRTFMNDSGTAVSSLKTFYKIKTADIYVVHDDLDIVLGEYKIQFGKGPKDHNGLRSVYERLGTKDFWHVRVGIMNSDTRIVDNGRRIDGEAYVLMPFLASEQTTINEVIDQISTDLMLRIG